MRTISVQQMPNGFEVETPTFAYWLKAGIAFTLGAGIVTVTAAITWFVVGWGMIAAMLGSRLH